MSWMWHRRKIPGSLNEDGMAVYTPVPETLEKTTKPVGMQTIKYADVGNPGDNLPKGWDRGQSKGRYFLVNETFVRVDDSDYVNIRSFVGKYKQIEVNTGWGMTRVITPKCEGYVFRPLPRWYVEYSATSGPMAPRCMTEEELNEAAKDHIFLRNVRHFTTSERKDKLWIEYYHSTGDFGDSYARQKLLAFNRALNKKREAENLARHERGEPYDYADLINSTYDPKQHTLRGLKM